VLRALLRAGHRKRRAGAGVNGKLRRNKQKALAFVPDTAHYFCIISSNLTERVEAFVSGRFLCFVSLSPQRNEKEIDLFS